MSVSTCLYIICSVLCFDMYICVLSDYTTIKSGISFLCNNLQIIKHVTSKAEESGTDGFQICWQEFPSHSVCPGEKISHLLNIIDSLVELVMICRDMICIICPFFQGQFVDSYDPTIENTFNKNMKIQGQEYEVLVVDTAGGVNDIF